MQGMITQRTTQIDGSLLEYSLERKNVKNLNLHVRKGGNVYVSANTSVLEDKIDEFLISKGDFIRNGQDKLKEQEQYRPVPKQYVRGEIFYIQGRVLRPKVTQAVRDKFYSDGVYLFLEVKDQQDVAKKERMVKRFLNKQCKVFLTRSLQSYILYSRSTILRFLYCVFPIWIQDGDPAYQEKALSH